MYLSPLSLAYLLFASRWKHAASCHQGSTISGEGDVYEDDFVFQKLLELEK